MHHWPYFCSWTVAQIPWPSGQHLQQPAHRCYQHWKWQSQLCEECINPGVWASPRHSPLLQGETFPWHIYFKRMFTLWPVCAKTEDFILLLWSKSSFEFTQHWGFLLGLTLTAAPVGDSVPARYGEEGGGSCDPKGTRNHRQKGNSFRHCTPYEAQLSSDYN